MSISIAKGNNSGNRQSYSTLTESTQSKEGGKPDVTMLDGEQYVITIGRTVGDVFDAIAALRSDYIYSSPFDERYWHGGIHGRLTPQMMRLDHYNDAASRLALVYDTKGRLKGYSRFSVGIVKEYPDLLYSINFCQQVQIALVHIILLHRDICGKQSVIITPTGERLGKVSTVLYETVLQYCHNVGCLIAYAEIAIHPIPNLPSLKLHHDLGFIPAGTVPKSKVFLGSNRVEYSVFFSCFLRSLSPEY